MIKYLIIISLFHYCAWAQRIESGRDEKTEKLLDAIWQVEASGRYNPPDGDNGKSIGPLQIQRAYWQDSIEHGKFGGTYQDCRDLDYSKKVVEHYWKRYEKRAYERGDAETLSRIHQGGPGGARKESTKKYWEKVKVELSKE